MYAAPRMQNTEEIIVKYAVDAKLFRLGSTNPKTKSYPWIFFIEFFFQLFSIYEKILIQNHNFGSGPKAPRQ